VKGEKLVLFTEVEIDAQSLRKKLIASGLPNIWIPKESILIEKIPSLASGKVDFQMLRELASQR
jgi:non-ribosomal peptide synthetase component E (peptide arylation enzyme)